MSTRKIQFANGEFYHIFNRGVDKRSLFLDAPDFDRFVQSMQEFNTLDPIGSIYEHCRPTKFGSEASKLGKTVKTDGKLVNITAYCLNLNHFHFILEQVSEKGIEKFMQRLGTGYTKYFNHKYERTGALFQGVFKSVHIDSNEYLLHVSAYVNLNNRVHKFGSEASKFRSSWEEYAGGVGSGKGICATEVVLGQFRKRRDYSEFAENSLRGTLEKRGLLQAADLLE